MMPLILYLLIALVLAALVVAYFIRASWALGLPGLFLLALILYLLFGT
ncbi:MAG TPA: hypothetical protein VGL77_19290 [Armatimonadota bacterium]